MYVCMYVHASGVLIERYDLQNALNEVHGNARVYICARDHTLQHEGRAHNPLICDIKCISTDERLNRLFRSIVMFRFVL